MDPEKLDLILEVLQERGVTQFSCADFSVTIGIAPQEDEKPDYSAEAKAAATTPTAARGIYGHKSLWPDGTPPKFPVAQ